MSDENFNPSDMDELNKKFDQIIRDTENGYCVEFHLTRLAARDMVKEWMQALLGDKEAYKSCMDNYDYIMSCIMEELQKDPE